MCLQQSPVRPKVSYSLLYFADSMAELLQALRDPVLGNPSANQSRLTRRLRRFHLLRRSHPLPFLVPSAFFSLRIDLEERVCTPEAANSIRERHFCSDTDIRSSSGGAN